MSGAPGTAQQQQPDDRADDFSGDAHRGQLLIFMANMLHRNRKPARPYHLAARPQENPHRQGARHLRDRRAIDAHRDHRPAVGLRRGAAGPDPRQGPRAQFHLELLVRAHATYRAEPSDRRAASTRSSATRPSARCSPTAPSIVKRLKTVPLEAVVRGYVIGSGWKDYQKTGAISGIKLPAGLRQAAKLPQTLFTPSTKAALGDNDETISFEQAAKIVGADIAARVRDTAIALYEFAAKHARERGIIIADTKFEFAHGRGRRARAHRRSADARFLALLARRYLARRHEPAVLRQAVRARLSRDARLEQEGAGAEAAARGHRGTQREIPRGAQRLTAEAHSELPPKRDATSISRTAPMPRCSVDRASPSVSAAGPGCRMIDDLIS